MVLFKNSERVQGNGSVFLDWLPSPRLRFDMQSPDASASLVLLDLRTTTGPAGLAVRMADAIHGLRRGGRTTVALVQAPGSGATTLLALACDKLFMADGARLAPIDPAAFQPPANEADAAALRAAVKRYCAHRPRVQPLYEAFVDPGPEVYGVEFEGRPGQPGNSVQSPIPTSTHYPQSQSQPRSSKGPRRIPVDCQPTSHSWNYLVANTPLPGQQHSRVGVRQLYWTNPVHSAPE